MSALQSQCRSEGFESANVTGEQIAAAVRVGAGLSNHGNILLSDRAPLTDRLVSLSTGSVPLLHWSAHEPVTFDDDRATVRVRSDMLFNQPWRPATFVNVDGEWKLTHESTCELSASLLLRCA